MITEQDNRFTFNSVPSGTTQKSRGGDLSVSAASIRPSEKEIELAFDEIDTTPADSVRAVRKDSVIIEYKNRHEELDKGEVCFCYEHRKWELIDGSYRMAAAKARGLTRDKFKNGGSATHTEIMDRAAKANCKHGEKLTVEDIRKIHSDLKERHPDWTLRQIAKFLGRSPGNHSAIVNGKKAEYRANSKERTGKTRQDGMVGYHAHQACRGLKSFVDRVQLGLELRPFKQWKPKYRQEIDRLLQMFDLIRGKLR